MFQRLTNLFFGEVEEVAAELNGPKPCMTEADEEGWMIVNLPGDSEPVTEDDAGTRPNAQAFLDRSNRSTRPRTESPIPAPHRPQKQRRTRKGRARGAPASSGPSAGPTDLGATMPRTFLKRARLSTPSSTPPVSPSSGKGATAETSPMEDLLIEHPSMSVYVSSNNFSLVSNSNLSVVGEESVLSLASSTRAAEPAAVPGAVPSRASRGAAVQAAALAKVTQAARVQRSKARVERRHLSRNRLHHQNLTREQVPRHAAHARKSFLHQPSQRNFCH